MVRTMRNVPAYVITPVLFTALLVITSFSSSPTGNTVMAQEKKEVKAESLTDALAKGGTFNMEIDLAPRLQGILNNMHERPGQLELGKLKDGKSEGKYSYEAPLGAGKLTATAKIEIKDDKVLLSFTEQGLAATGKGTAEFSPKRDKAGKVVSLEGNWKNGPFACKWVITLVEPKLVPHKAVTAALKESEYKLKYIITEPELMKFAGDDKRKQVAAKNFLMGRKTVEMEGTFSFKEKDGVNTFTQTLGKKTDTYEIVKLKVDGTKLFMKSRLSPAKLTSEDSLSEIEFEIKDGIVVSGKGKAWNSSLEFGLTLERK